jgi:hypothetical protein
MDVYISQYLIVSSAHSKMSFLFIVVLRMWKSLTPKDVTAVKGLMFLLSLTLLRREVNYIFLVLLLNFLLI